MTDFRAGVLFGAICLAVFTVLYTIAWVYARRKR